MRINLAAVVLLVPAILWVVPRYGAFGAACLWIALNAVYVIIGIQLMHRRLLPAEKWRWYLRDVGLPATAAGVALLLMQAFAPTPMQQRLGWAAFLLLAGALAFVAAGATVADVRARLALGLRRAAST